MKTPNINPDMEQALLACILTSPGILGTLPTTPDQFHVHAHRELFAALSEMHTARLGIDLMSVSDYLERTGRLAKVGGPAFLGKIASAQVYTFNAETYAASIAEMADNRQLMNVLNQLAARTAEGEAAETVAAETISALSKVGSRNKGAVHLSQWHLEAKAEIAARGVRDHDDYALASGFIDLDRLIGPVFPDDGTMVLISGEAGMGKTILATDIVRQWSERAAGAIYSSEMSGFRMMLRDYATHTDQRVSDMKRGKVDMAKLDALDEFYGKSRIFASEDSNWTTASLRADLTRLKYEHGVKWYLFDYLALMNDTVKGEEHDRTREISKRLLQINRSLGMACITIHTLNKSGVLAGAAGIGYDADVVMKLEEGADVYGGGDVRPVRVTLLKNRDGEEHGGSVTLGLLTGKPHFVSLTSREVAL